jgi:dTDP-4-dehydrorhamnose reductase
MARKKLFVIGARGFLGQHVVRLAEQWHDVWRGERTANGSPNSVQIDIADPASVDWAFQSLRPERVLLLAAISDIDACEKSPQAAFATNARGPENVARACARFGARMLFTSSAAVFDGRKHGYREDDQRTPLSVYGKTKEAAENSVTKILPSAIILRFGLVIGFAEMRGTNAMLDRVVAKWKNGEAVEFSTREARNPIDAESLAQMAVDMLALGGIQGTYHVGAAESVTRFELARMLARRAGIPADLVRPQDQDLPGRAPRGEDHFLLTEKIETDCGFPVPTINQVVERCFS